MPVVREAETKNACHPDPMSDEGAWFASKASKSSSLALRIQGQKPESLAKLRNRAPAGKNIERGI